MKHKTIIYFPQKDEGKREELLINCNFDIFNCKNRFTQKDRDALILVQMCTCLIITSVVCLLFRFVFG